MGLHAELGAGLVAAEHVEEGRFHLKKALGLRQVHGWSIPANLSELLAETDGAEDVDSRRVVEPLAERAEELLMEGIAVQRGILTGVNVELERDGERRRYHFLCVEGDRPGSSVDCRVPANRAYGFLSGQPLGAPMGIRLDHSGPRPRVLSVRLRPEGAPWDIMPERDGKVDHVNPSKGLAAVNLGGGKTALVHFDRFSEASRWVAGDEVRIRFSEKEGRIRVLDVSRPAAADYGLGVEVEVPF